MFLSYLFLPLMPQTSSEERLFLQLHLPVFFAVLTLFLSKLSAQVQGSQAQVFPPTPLGSGFAVTSLSQEDDLCPAHRSPAPIHEFVNDVCRFLWVKPQFGFCNLNAEVTNGWA